MENIDPTRKFSLIDAKNGGKYLVFDGYPFSVNKKTATTWYMVCASRCGTSMTVSPNYGQIKKFPAPIHSHPPKNPEEGRKFVEKVKKAIKKDPTKTVKTVYEDVCAKNASTVPPPFWTMKSSLYRARAKRVPKIPHDAKNFEITGKWRRTLEKKNS